LRGHLKGRCQLSGVLGYYTLSSFGIDAGVVPPEIAKKLPRNPLIPATLLGRLAVDERHHGEGIGEFLFRDALHRSRAQSGQIAAVAVVVEAIDERAERFYQHFGFIPSFSDNHRPFIHDDEDRETAICVTRIVGSDAARKIAEPSGIRCAGPLGRLRNAEGGFFPQPANECQFS
jgi:GNAT acetyltransferase-like protein